MTARKRSAKSALSELDPVYLLCRDLGHAWFEEGWYRGALGTCRFLTCGRCGSERHDDNVMSLVQRARHYYYAEGYLLDGVKATRADVRAVRLSQARVFSSLEELREKLQAERSKVNA